MKVKGDEVVVHGLRGRQSNRRIDEKIRERAMGIVKSLDWHDFRPTFASEQLAKRHQIQVSKETVRKWMMAEGVWQSRGRKLREVHAWRPRRSHYGELVQWDTSDHDWLEGRGEPVPHLVRMIDDATSRSWGRFVQRDGTRENMGVLWEYVTRFGRAVDYYTDRDSMFTVAPRPGAARVGNRLDRGLLPASKRTCGTQFSDRSGPAHQAASSGQREDNAGGQRVSGEGVLAGMEHEVRAPGAGRRGSASPAGIRFRVRLGAQPCRVPDHHQQLHLSLLQRELSDRAGGCAGGNEAPELARGTVAER